MGSVLTRREFLGASALAGAAIALPGCVSGATSIAAPARFSPSFEAYRALDAVALAELVARGDASPTELLELAIARAEAVEPRVRAITVRHFELAREAARGALPAGPLRGVPYLLKDLGIGLRGTVTTDGSRLFADALHERDSTLTERYRAAGLVMFGKTHSPEFGGSPSSESALHGATHNPWDLARSAGGSSGGSAAAVAAGILPAAHATDGGGSIRIPASSCGLFGMKPTRGRTPLGPAIYEAWGGLSAAHCVSRSVRDSAALLDATQGGAVGDPYAAPPRERPYMEEIAREPGRLRIALMRTPLIPVEVDAACLEAVDRAASLCAKLGHDVVEERPALDIGAVYGAYGSMSGVGSAIRVADRERALGRSARADELEPITRRYIEGASKVAGIELSRARTTLHGASRTFGEFMQRYDAILSPTMAHVPPALGVLSLSQDYDAFVGPATRASAFTSIFNMTGQPAMSVPLHWTEPDASAPRGVPVGVMFAGRFGDEATLFRLAAQLERAAPWFDRTPVL